MPIKNLSGINKCSFGFALNDSELHIAMLVFRMLSSDELCGS